jgi:hypothetical protein
MGWTVAKIFDVENQIKFTEKLKALRNFKRPS